MSFATPAIDAPAHPRTLRRRWPATFWIGLGAILALEVLLFSDVALSGRHAVSTEAALVAGAARQPHTGYARLARWVAVNMTPLVWPAYVVMLEGVLVAQTGTSPVRRRPHHFALLCLGSVVIWCLFDGINFINIDSWQYIRGVPVAEAWDRYWGLTTSFATIVPAMLMSGQVFLNLGWFDAARSRRWRMPRWGKWLALVSGLAMVAWVFLSRSPTANLTLWTSLVFLLDPVNLKLGRPAMFRDWQNGWYGRTLAAFAGGLLCGLLWEFWNYWALIKWVYHLPFLGRLEHLKYFEMPAVGLIGFIPFGLECWVMWQSMRIPLDGLAEPLPDERTLL